VNKSELEKTIQTLERIRDILLDSGIRSEGEDASLQRICNQIVVGQDVDDDEGAGYDSTT
jgi:hypothetical protein